MADEFVYSQAEATHFAKRSRFYRGRAIASDGPGEADHELLWLRLDEAEAQLAHRSHRWAVHRERLAREDGAAI